MYALGMVRHIVRSDGGYPGSFALLPQSDRIAGAPSSIHGCILPNRKDPNYTRKGENSDRKSRNIIIIYEEFVLQGYKMMHHMMLQESDGYGAWIVL